MSFNWDMEDEQDENRFDEPSVPINRRSYRWWVIGLILVLAGGIGSFVWWGQREINTERAELTQKIQTFLDSQAELLVTGQGEAFIQAAGSDPYWQSDLLQPRSLEFWRGNPRVTDFTFQNNVILVNVAWDDPSGETYQRVMMVEEEVGGAISLSSAPAGFWGDLKSANASWGGLAYYEIDEAWVDQVLQTVDDVQREYCPQSEPTCLEFELFLSIRQSTLLQPIAWPSPRVWGLDENGDPPQAYWDGLEAMLVQNLLLDEPNIVFAVPVFETSRYNLMALQFMADNPEYKIQVIGYADEETVETFGAVNAILLRPTFDLVKDGEMLDLTELVASDPTFNPSDYYEQHWQATQWNGRTWFIPRAAEFSVIYYDRNIGGVESNQLYDGDWQWDEFWALTDALEEGGQFPFRFVSRRPDWLYALGYSHADQCQEIVRISCNPSLSVSALAFALETAEAYREDMPDYSGLAPSRENIAFVGDISPSTRRTVLFADVPLEYERHLQSRGTAILPYPSFEADKNITPLWVDGYAINANDPNPIATWKWISYISQQPITQTDRKIPARPSVAKETDYWTDLPGSLETVMTFIFAESRPVLLEERGLLSSDVLDAYYESGQSAEEFAAGLLAEQGSGWFVAGAELETVGSEPE